MITHQNAFIRKFADKAAIIIVTDWQQYEDLMRHAKNGNEDPDFLLGCTTMKTIYSNMLPSITLNTHEVKDISEDTHGFGLAGIITGSCPCGPLWSYRNVRDPLLGGMISEQKNFGFDESA